MRVLLALIVATALLAVTGCVPDEPMPTLPPTPTAEPVFESEEEALAAAEEAYSAYVAAVDQAFQTAEPGGLEDVATGSALDSALESVEVLREDGRRQEGNSTVTSISPADLSPLLDGSEGQAQIYACLDLSAVRVVSPDGTFTSNTEPIIPMFVTLALESDRILIAEEEVWDGASPCV